MEKESRYIIGIDLGTTNSAVTFVDTEAGTEIRIFGIPQMVSASTAETRDTLPSFHYQPTAAEREADEAVRRYEVGGGVVGVYARDHGTFMPGRMIASAKSWLSHAGVDRTAKLLPWQARREESEDSADVKKLSPVEASAAYLTHIARAWDAKFPGYPLAEQDIILTLPASFDEVARELTVRAAKLAGLNRVVLIEEPQAAFYAWLAKHLETWQNEVQPGQKILVCDIGGGTTDFTLIRVRQSEHEA